MVGAFNRHLYIGANHLLGCFPIISSFPMIVSTYWQQKQRNNTKTNHPRIAAYIYIYQAYICIIISPKHQLFSSCSFDKPFLFPSQRKGIEGQATGRGMLIYIDWNVVVILENTSQFRR